MLKIGEFSKLCHVSVRMLRHFEEMGLLLPERVDPFTGYRYYTASQLTTVSTIVSLQRMGLSLTAIGEILESSSTSQALETHIEACYRKKLKEAEKLQVQLWQLKAAGERLRRKEEIMKNYIVVAKELPSCQVASLRDTLSTYTEEAACGNSCTLKSHPSIPSSPPRSSTPRPTTTQNTMKPTRM